MKTTLGFYEFKENYLDSDAFIYIPYLHKQNSYVYRNPYFVLATLYIVQIL